MVYAMRSIRGMGVADTGVMPTVFVMSAPPRVGVPPSSTKLEASGATSVAAIRARSREGIPEDNEGIDPAKLNAIANATIADLVESTPDVLSVLTPLGLDVCCGGRPLGEALALHGVEAGPVLRRIALLTLATPAQ